MAKAEPRLIAKHIGISARDEACRPLLATVRAALASYPARQAVFDGRPTVRLRQLEALLVALKNTDAGSRFLVEGMVIGRGGIPEPEIDFADIAARIEDAIDGLRMEIRGASRKQRQTEVARDVTAFELAALFKQHYHLDRKDYRFHLDAFLRGLFHANRIAYPDEHDEEVFFLCWGAGANGKSTLIGMVSFVLGDYADDLPFSALEKSRFGAGIPNDIAKLVGRRFVTASESNDVRLNEARIKALTGRDPITARFLHQEFFTFEPVAKFWLTTNTKPEVRDDSEGFWRRVHLIPFTQSFIGREDRRLKDRLRAEASGVLTWLVDAAMLREGGAKLDAFTVDQKH